MTRSTKTRKSEPTSGQRTLPRTLLIAGLIAAGPVFAVAKAEANPVDPPAVPANIEVPDGNRPFRMLHAVGTQNYICLAAGQPWILTGPQATLFNDEGKQVLTHFLSPNPVEGDVARATWQHSRDTSSVWGVAIATSSDPLFVAPGAIPWLLLRVTGAQAGPADGDRFLQTTFIQRVNTVGGSAPSPTCPDLGRRSFVPYEAEYVFYRER